MVILSLQIKNHHRRMAPQVLVYCNMFPWYSETIMGPLRLSDFSIYVKQSVFCLINHVVIVLKQRTREKLELLSGQVLFNVCQNQQVQIAGIQINSLLRWRRINKKTYLEVAFSTIEKPPIYHVGQELSSLVSSHSPAY